MGLGVLLVDAAHLLLSQADTLLLGAIRGARAVALLSVAGGVAAFSMFPMIAVGATAVPAFASLWAQGDVVALERLARRAVRRAFTAQVVLAAAILALAKPILSAYGADFDEARLPLLFILAGQLANTGTGYVGSLMTMTGHQAAVGRTIWLAAAINVALVVTGARLFGVPGAAAGTALSALGWNLWLHRLVVRHVGVRVSFADALFADWPSQPRPRSAAVASSIMPAARAAASTTRL
ncbi:MAG: MATE family efflux transporter [Polyangiaceae bacterium]